MILGRLICWLKHGHSDIHKCTYKIKEHTIRKHNKYLPKGVRYNIYEHVYCIRCNKLLYKRKIKSNLKQHQITTNMPYD